jgi:hypothetical protein
VRTNRVLRALLPCCVLLLSPLTAWSQELAEASRVRVLLLLDTDDRMGATWGLDGDNMKEVIEAAFIKQGLKDRFTIDMLVGKNVTSDHVMKYYANLKSDPSEALLFYYSGHGAFHLNRGHFMALTRGQLYRRDLIAAMQKHDPKLIVILTDCCANISGGAWQEEPKKAETNAIEGRAGGPSARAKMKEPAGTTNALVMRKQPTPPRPDVQTGAPLKPAVKAEPPRAIVFGLSDALRPVTPKAKKLEPQASSGAMSRNIILSTGSGKIPLATVTRETDGAVLRDLLFRHTGVVDINGCKKGALSHGTLQWGGSLFTLAFFDLVRKKSSDFDKNGDGFVEWSEFFPAWQNSTVQAGQRVGGGRVNQSPEATKLAEPSRKQ